MPATDIDAKLDGAGAAWRPVAWAAALVLAGVAVAAMRVAPLPEPRPQAALPAPSVGWLQPKWGSLPAHWLQGMDAGALEHLPRDGRPVQISLLLPEKPAGAGRALLFLPAAAGEPAVFVNGASVPSAASIGEPYPAASRMRPMTIAIPTSYFRPGANEVDAIFAGVEGPVLMAPPLLGDEAGIAPVAERSSAWIGPLRRVAVPLSLAAAALALAAVAFSSLRGWFLGVAAAAAAAGCRLLLAGADWPPWPVAWRSPLDHALLAAALASLACAAANRPRIRGDANTRGAARLRVAVGAAGALAVAAAIVAAGEVVEPFSGAWMVRLEAFYGLCLLVLASALAIVSAWVAGRGVVRFARARLDMSGIVRLQRVQIEQARLALERQMRHAALLEERQRLARDVHDGVGGTLASLLARIRMRRIGIDQIESELVGGLADLRLIVDSMDAAGENIGAALAVFRARIAPQVEQAGMRLRWEQADDPDCGGGDPQWVLHLYRLMQEAANNAMRHSGGRELHVAVCPLDGRRLRIDIVDDGAGVSESDAATGNGLRNMAWRASRLGAELCIERASAAGGTRVRVQMPLPALGAAQSRGDIKPS